MALAAAAAETAAELHSEAKKDKQKAKAKLDAEKQSAKQEEAKALKELRDEKAVLQKAKDVTSQLHQLQGELEVTKAKGTDAKSATVRLLEQEMRLLAISQAEVEKQANAKKKARNQLLTARGKLHALKLFTEAEKKQEAAAVCECGNTFMDDSQFCRKCGKAREVRTASDKKLQGYTERSAILEKLEQERAVAHEDLESHQVEAVEAERDVKQWQVLIHIVCDAMTEVCVR